MPCFTVPTILRFITMLLLLVFTGDSLLANTAGESGEQSTSHAIVNGSPPAFAHPWMVAMVFNSTSSRPVSQLQTCGGTLVAPQWVITAAHCVAGRFPHELSVVIGREKLDPDGGEIIGIAEFIIHQDSENYGSDADLALLRLATPSAYEPIAVASSGMASSLSGGSLQLLGWGTTFDDQNVPCELALDDGGSNSIGYQCKTLTYLPTNRPLSLQQADLQLKDLQSCFDRTAKITGLEDTAENRAKFLQIFSRSLCGWAPGDAQAACFGDSGGPLVTMIDGKWYLVGVTSQILLGGCPLENQVSWFVDVSSFSGFLAESMSRDAALGMAALCPEPVRPVVEYGTADNGSTPVVLRWPASGRARYYTLYYAALNPGVDIAGSRRFPAETLEFRTTLTSGDHYLVAVRPSSDGCDGPLSTALELLVP